MSESVEHIYRSFGEVFTSDPDSSEDIGRTVPLPRFEKQMLINLCLECTNFFKSQPILLELTGDFVIVGDIHGNISDLIQILATTKLPPITKYIFLGDVVDRGQFSIETITLVFTLMLKFPTNIFFLRGNHEVQSVNKKYGFRDQLFAEYNDHSLWEAFNEAFSWIPFAAIVNETTFLVHGGLSPRLIRLQQIQQYIRPIVEPDSLLIDLLWSDPSKKLDYFTTSPRGIGCVFGEGALKEFLSQNGLNMLIRGHQCIEKGVEQFGKGALFTVFSASNYCEIQGNLCGIIKLSQNNEIEAFNLPLLHDVKRSEAIFKTHNAPIPKIPQMNSLKFGSHSNMDNPSVKNDPRNRKNDHGEIPNLLCTSNRFISSHFSGVQLALPSVMLRNAKKKESRVARNSFSPHF